MPRNSYFVPNLQDVRVRTRGYLPHWEMQAATYSITYRLHDSLPQHVVHALNEERRAIARLHANGRTAIDRAHIRFAFEHAIDRSLDCGHGAAHLADDRVANIVASNLEHFAGRDYELLAWCVMPNHVHVVMRVISGRALASIIHSWKSYTAKEANRILGRDGPFWSREYFDRIIRSPDDLSWTVEYVRNNPVKAGLSGWKWVGPTGEPPVDRPASGRRS
jgi:REP element-mobilizing transposase RayT